ncbi:MAG: hypothetical protein ABIP78_07135 [Pyrinomonadaceae bacterium]
MAFAFSFAASAQKTPPTPMKVIQTARRSMAVAAGNNLYCAGYIQFEAISTGNKMC